MKEIRAFITTHMEIVKRWEAIIQVNIIDTVDDFYVSIFIICYIGYVKLEIFKK